MRSFHRQFLSLSAWWQHPFPFQANPCVQSHLDIFCRQKPLKPHRLLFPISSKGSFIGPFQQIEQHISHPLIDQLWNIGCMGN